MIESLPILAALQTQGYPTPSKKTTSKVILAVRGGGAATSRRQGLYGDPTTGPIARPLTKVILECLEFPQIWFMFVILGYFWYRGIEI